MQIPPPPPPPPLPPPPHTEPPPLVPDDPWDWSDLLDFTADDPAFSIPVEQTQNASVLGQTSDGPVASQPGNSGEDRVRKRDPRMACSNYLAGRVPCACPELDAMAEKLEEEENGAPGKKRSRTSTVSLNGRGGAARCQVPDCGADISQLKGYHKRHRICLRCAHASCVVIDAEQKRYCQQCGKFHILTDFDEGKRSCRRKLERHNNRRRRRPIDSKGSSDKDPHGDALNEDVTHKCEARRDILASGSVSIEKESLESEDGHGSTLCSTIESQNIRGDSTLPFAASQEIQNNTGTYNREKSLSPSYCDNRSPYSSMCPTGRISFKLYHWNPAEFPRRLRQQICSWLASMPVELEGYIRPGCTILTVFLAMPKSMWGKLLEDPLSYVHELVAPGMMLSRRGNILVNLNNMLFRVLEDGSPIMKVKLAVRAPRLHYVRPVCFEAGKSMEFIVCGSHLQQPNLRFLVSFAGKYLVNDYCIASVTAQTIGDAVNSVNLQSYKIYTQQTEPNYFGPAFIEVENESGLSNFVPVLVGDRDMCSEVNILQQRFDTSCVVKNSQIVGDSSDKCEASTSKQTAFFEFLLDIAWLLKDPASESFHSVQSPVQIQRFSCILDCLIRNKSTTILPRIVQRLEGQMDNIDDKAEIYVRQLQNLMNYAKGTFHEGGLVLEIGDTVPYREYVSQCCLQCEEPLVAPFSYQDVRKSDLVLEQQPCPISPMRSETVPLLNGKPRMNMDQINGHPRKSYGCTFSGSVLGLRHTIYIVAIAAVCFGVCAAVFHPQRVGEFAVSVNRRLFG